MPEYSAFRSTVTFKPRPACPPVDIYACLRCGRQYQAIGTDEHAAPVCCNEPTTQLVPRLESEFPEGYGIVYSIEGGLNYDAVKVSWRCPEGITPAWVLLKTYTGTYLRYLTPKKRPPFVFALADEDAYVYCDKHVCERCTFRCKLGFAVYVCFLEPEPLLLEVQMDKVAARFKTRIF